LSIVKSISPAEIEKRRHVSRVQVDVEERSTPSLLLWNTMEPVGAGGRGRVGVGGRVGVSRIVIRVDVGGTVGVTGIGVNVRVSVTLLLPVASVCSTGSASAERAWASASAACHTQLQYSRSLRERTE
jgi:hypothetical protein